jgi:hypothetical protein
MVSSRQAHGTNTFFLFFSAPRATKGDSRMARNAYLLTAVLTVGAAVMLASCGDDENPAGPGTPPTPSVLSVATSVTNSTAASWTMCVDTDFTEYRLYRSTEPGIAQNPPATPLRVTANLMDTTFTDTGLAWGETYYYAVRTFDSENLSSWSNEVTAVIPDSSGGSGDALTCYEVQGQQAESPYLDQEITVTGIVTVGGDEFFNSSGPVAFLGDPEGGPWTGLVLYGDSIAALARGDSILVTGTVDEYYGLTELTFINDVQILSSGHDMPPSTPIETGDISNTDATPEEYEAVLCIVSDAFVTEVQTYGEFLIDDGSGDCLVDDMGDYTYSPAVGDTVYSAAGVVWYTYGEYLLEPRDDADLDVSSGGGPSDVLTCYEVQSQADSSTYIGQTVSVTGIITADPEDYTATTAIYSVLSDAGGGPWSGLLLFGDDLAGLQRGDSVTVSGVVDEYYGMTELKYPITYEVHSSGNPLPDPEEFDTGDLSPLLDLEQWESVFVTVFDVDVTQTGLPHYTWAMNDGSGECYAGTMGVNEPAVGDHFASVTGLLWYSYDFKIQPRDDDDMTQ